MQRLFQPIMCLGKRYLVRRHEEEEVDGVSDGWDGEGSSTGNYMQVVPNGP